jgi:chromosome segregation protein
LPARTATAAAVAAGVKPEEIPHGAVWRRVDLHLHTPGVSSFHLPSGVDPSVPDQRARLADAYVQQLRQQGIEVAALTDYNGIRLEWFDAIRTRAAEVGIVVFPGAELSFQEGKGLHLLAVFPLDTNPETINRYLDSMDRERTRPLVHPSSSVHRPIVPQENLFDAVRALREQFDCLIIVPHPGEENGLFHSFKPGVAAKYLLEWKPDAVDHCPDGARARLRSTGVLTEDFFGHMAFVEFSDNHSIAGIGTRRREDGCPRATYLKLSATDLDALRLALHDPGTRLSVGEIPVPLHARITGLEVEGSGFLGNLRIRWNDDLNVIIGGRGAGKSAVIEVLRYVLDIDAYADESYRHDLVWHALGSGGRATVTVERPTGSGTSHVYRIARVRGEAPQVTEGDTGRPVEARPIEVFGPTNEPVILGQREIQAVSGDEAYRLRLLDDLIGDEAKRAAREVARAREALGANARAILETVKRLGRRAEHEERLRAIDHEISVYEKEGVAEKLQTHTGLSSDGRTLEQVEQELAEQQDAWDGLADDLRASLTSVVSRLRAAKSIHARLLHDAADDLDQLTRTLEGLLEQGRAAFTASRERLAATRRQWREILAPIEEELLRVRRELRSDTLDPDRLIQLTDERTGLLPLVERLKGMADHLDALRRERQELLRRYREVRHREHVVRREQCLAVEGRLRGRVRLSIAFKGQKEAYQRELAALLRGSRVTDETLKRLVAPEATDGAALADAIRDGAERVEREFGVSHAMAQRVVEWFQADEERLLHLDTLTPADSLGIDLMVDGQPRSLEHLSIGQRATAILMLLFALRNRPLVLDQPEDDLDNRFVYEDVVALLREEKGLPDRSRRRQIIAATHNPNIPVLGDAELVLALEAREDRCHVVGRASIDDRNTREQIKSLLEGGAEAFRRRAEKYGGVSWT